MYLSIDTNRRFPQYQAINFDGDNDDNNTDSNNDVEINIYYIQQYISPTVTKKIFIK